MSISSTIIGKPVLIMCFLCFDVFPVNFVKFLRTPFSQPTVSQNMKAYTKLWPSTVV